MMMPRRIILLAWLVICGLAGFLAAENRAFSDTPKAGAARGDVDVADFSDWRFACAQPPKSGPKQCRIFQRVTWGKDKGHENAMSVIMFNADSKATSSKGEKKPVALMRIVTPLGVDIQTGMNMTIGTRGKVVKIPFGVCVPAGCLATFGLAEDAVGKIKAADGMMIAFKGADAPKSIALKVSTKGFSQAVDALTKTKQ